MSYILDALKKAESERKLGSIPNVYSPAPSASDMADGQSWRKWLPWLLATSTFAVLLLGLAWLQPWRQQAPVALNPALAVPVAPPAAAPPPPVAPRAIAETKIEPAAAASAAASSAIQQPEKAPISPQPAPSTTEKTAAAIMPPVMKASSSEPVSAPSPSDEDLAGTLHDLPQNLQAELPAIVVNGYIYAKNPADRSVLINQKLLHEGDQIAPQFVLEKMLPKGAILSYKGYRYRVAF